MTAIRIVTPSGIDIGIDLIVREWLTETAFDIEAGAKRRAPVDTGRLRASITTKVQRREAIVGTDVEYAEPVHEGTAARARKSRGGLSGRIVAARPGKPFLADAFDQVIATQGNPIRL